MSRVPIDARRDPKGNGLSRDESCDRDGFFRTGRMARTLDYPPVFCDDMTFPTLREMFDMGKVLLGPWPYAVLKDDPEMGWKLTYKAYAELEVLCY